MLRDCTKSKDAGSIFSNRHRNFFRRARGKGTGNFFRERKGHSSDPSSRPIAPSVMLPSALSSSSLLLRSRRDGAPRQHISSSALSDASMVSSHDLSNLGDLQRRLAAEQKPISTASAAAWWTRWTCRPARSATRHPDRSAAPAAHTIPSSSEIGRVRVCSTCQMTARTRLTTRSGGCLCVCG
jgi:hypothetical protein